MLFKLHTVDDMMLDCGIQKIEDNMKRAGAHCVALVVPQGSVSTEGEGGDIYNREDINSYMYSTCSCSSTCNDYQILKGMHYGFTLLFSITFFVIMKVLR